MKKTLRKSLGSLMKFPISQRMTSATSASPIAETTLGRRPPNTPSGPAGGFPGACASMTALLPVVVNERGEGLGPPPDCCVSPSGYPSPSAASTVSCLGERVVSVSSWSSAR
jgi:hypothetical protein